MRRTTVVVPMLGLTVLVVAGAMLAVGVHGGWAFWGRARSDDATVVVASVPPSTSSARLAPDVLSTARQIAGRAMNAPGTAQAVEADFETVAEVAWPGERVFGDLQKSYRGHRILVLLVEQNVVGRMRQAPPVPGRTTTPAARVGGLQSFYDEVLGSGISSTVWDAGRTAPFELGRLGPVLTFDVPMQAIPAEQRVLDPSHHGVPEES